MIQMNKNRWVKLVLSIMICQAAGLIGSIFTSQSVNTWYQNIQKPSFNPPSWVFGPVWTTLFLMMGISLYLILIKRMSKKVKLGIVLFGVQLVLNILWSLFFFGLQDPLLGFIEITILWVFIALTIYQFRKIDKRSSYLLIPYILWVSFAAILNLSIWLLNSNIV
ncbi:MAG: tryptophan-rich sensory protein [Candidatus Aenigmarchaeota archaeon]|nr:tryptophan-rich sensory protein [Candidatus Aenigmarchaeota archaeon]